MLQLANYVRKLPRDLLSRTLKQRQLDTSGIGDFFDLAETLLTESSLDQALALLDRQQFAILAKLVAATSTAEMRPPKALDPQGNQVSTDDDLSQLVALLLVVPTDNNQIYVPVELISYLNSRLGSDLPTLNELTSSPPDEFVMKASGNNQQDTNGQGSQIAYATVIALAELLSTISAIPPRNLVKGLGFNPSDSKQIAETIGVAESDLAALFRYATETQLIELGGSHWHTTATGKTWVVQEPDQQWMTLAKAWQQSIPPTLRNLISQHDAITDLDSLHAAAKWCFPAGGKHLEATITRIVDSAVGLGLIVGGQLVDAAQLVIANEIAAAATVLAKRFPTQIDQVYLQHDLSIISPGRLRPELDFRLREMADLDTRDLASIYRVTPSSLQRALARGETAESIRKFLSKLSVTEIPQPLDYLIVETAAKFGTIRVTSAIKIAADAINRWDGTEKSTQTVIEVDAKTDAAAMKVDRSLAAISLQQINDHLLVSRFELPIVYWSLVDAKYSVVALSRGGEIMQLQRQRTTPSQTVRPDPVDQLIDRLGIGDDPIANGNSELEWLTRQLEAAIRARNPVSVTVRMPDGKTADYLLTPASVSNGRLRARDSKTEVERTLQISAIAAVTPA